MNESKKYKPILRWPGGKTRMVPLLLPRIPEHTCYAEAFAGGLGLLCAKPRSKVEVINDINGQLVSLYLNAQFHLPELLRQLEFVQGARKTLFDFMAEPGLTELQRVTRWFVRNRISFNGSMRSFAVAKAGGGGTGSRTQWMDLLKQINERLDGVTIENKDYADLLSVYDGKGTFFFLDPPYLKSDVSNYAGFTEKDMRGLRRKVEKIKGTWLLTVDDCPFNRDLWADCQVEAVRTRNGGVNQRTHSEATFGELIITPH